MAWLRPVLELGIASVINFHACDPALPDDRVKVINHGALETLDAGARHGQPVPVRALRALHYVASQPAAARCRTRQRGHPHLCICAAFERMATGQILERGSRTASAAAP
jgi:hypothetical protein